MSPRLDDLGKPKGTAGGPSYTPTLSARRQRGSRASSAPPRTCFWQTVIVVVWIILNAFAFSFSGIPTHLILLNLVFSTQAAYAAPLILLAQNRQADRDKAEMERDRERNARALADMEFIGREIAGIRLSLEAKADRSDVVEAVDRLTHALERVPGLEVGATAATEAAEEDPET